MSPYRLGVDDRERVSTPTSTLVPIPVPGCVRARSSTVAASNRPIQTSPPLVVVLTTPVVPHDPGELVICTCRHPELVARAYPSPSSTTTANLLRPNDLPSTHDHHAPAEHTTTNPPNRPLPVHDSGVAADKEVPLPIPPKLHLRVQSDFGLGPEFGITPGSKSRESSGFETATSHTDQPCPVTSNGTQPGMLIHLPKSKTRPCLMSDRRWWPGEKRHHRRGWSRMTSCQKPDRFLIVRGGKACWHLRRMTRATARDERVSTPVKERDTSLSREQVPRPVMGSRFTDSTVHQYRATKIETCGALGLEVTPGPPSARGFDAMPITPSSRTFDAAGRTFDEAKALDGPLRSFDGARMESFSSTLTSGMRNDPSQLDHPITPTTRYDPTRFDAVSPIVSRYDATRRNAPTPPGLARYDTSPIVSRFNISPVPRFDPHPTPGPYLARPVARHDASPTTSRYDLTRIRAPEPYTDTETDKDADAPSSPLSEDESVDESDWTDVEVVRGKVAETSSHPFPFSRPLPSHGSKSRRGPSPPSH